MTMSLPGVEANSDGISYLVTYPETCLEETSEFRLLQRPGS
jgi:hypothetical protein